MIKQFVFFSLILLVCISGDEPYSFQASPRIEKTINTNWTFNYFPEKDSDVKGFENPTYDDSKWPVVYLPHTWQTFETTQELHPYIRSASHDDDPYWWNGWGWYRKHLIVGRQYQNQKIYLEFDGVQKYSKIYLNGKYLGDHKGGFTSFYIDATDAVKFGEDNLLAVAVQNSLKDQFSIPPMNAGNFDVYGGIHRDVRLVIKNLVNVPFQGSYKHEGGTFITTPKVSEKEATVQIKTFVQNNTFSVQTVRLLTWLTDSTDLIIAKLDTVQSIQSGLIAEFHQTAHSIKNPHLWSPETPYIYHAYSEVYVDGKLSDNFRSTFGIRSVSWDFQTHRLILNGKSTHLHGINRHEEYVWLGATFPKWIGLRDMNDIRFGLEVNFMRTAHYPQAPYIYSFTDQSGICINEELPNIKKQDFNDVVQEQNCREMIRRDRNHPSIVFWSMGNETSDACDSRIAVEEDTTRILTVRQPYNESYNPKFVQHTDKEMSLESFLRCTIKGWYDKDDKNLEPDDNQWAGTEEWQHTQSNESVISNHNGAVWLYADHGADREYVNAPLKHVNPKGWVDSWRNPKYTYYQWQANFAQKPMVFIHPHFWRKQYSGQKKDFIVDSNCREVELMVNGQSKGKLQPAKSNNFCVSFKNVNVESGTIEAIATASDGTKIGHKVEMAGEPVALTIVPSSKKMNSGLDNILEFKVDITDSKGIHVIGAGNTLKFEVEGPAKLVGPAMYISDREKSEEYEGTMYIDAPVTNLIRATGKPGKVIVTVSSTGLKSASFEIEVLPSPDPNTIAGITEPFLNLEARVPIAINLKKANFIKAPSEVKVYSGELRFPVTQKSQFRQLLQEFIRKENPAIDPQTPDFKFTIDAFEAILNSTAKYTGQFGYIVADDYNFIVAQYNLSRAITKSITSRNLPEAYRIELSEYYASQIISKGKDKNFSFENELIGKIPDGGKVFVIAAKGERKDVIYDTETDLVILLQKIFPKVKDYNKDDLKKALELITRINPAVTYQSIRDKKTKERTNSYIVEPGRTILIPEEGKLLKTKFPDIKL